MVQFLIKADSVSLKMDMDEKGTLTVMLETPPTSRDKYQRDRDGFSTISHEEFMPSRPDPLPEHRTRPGVIKAIKQKLRAGGGTVEEITDYLAARFPNRPRDGMQSTVRTQVSTRLSQAGFPIRSRNTPAGKAYYCGNT